MALSVNQKESLNRAKLAALARSHFFADGQSPDGHSGRAEEDFSMVAFPGGAMLSTGTTTGDVVLALIANEPLSGMGGALAQAGQAQLHLIIDSDIDDGNPYATLAVVSPQDVARAAAGFEPSPTVWSVTGTDVALVTPAEGAIANAEVPLGDPLVDRIIASGADVVVEGGVIIGEVFGLEVARIGVSPDGGPPRLQVGVGAYDQEAFAVINPDVAPDAALPAVVDEIRQWRRVGADPHPINRLVRERWVRSLVMKDPSLVGLRRLAPIPSLRERNGLRDVVPALAVGTSADEEIVLVACSTGIDFGLIPTAADAAERYRADRIVLVVPKRDQYSHLERLIGSLRVPATVVDAPEPWA